MKTDEMFTKVVQKLQKDGLLNSRRKVRFEYAGDEEDLERSTAKQVGVNRKNVVYDFENYASSKVTGPMSRYISTPPPEYVTFPASLFRAYFPIGRSGTVEVILDTKALNPDDKVTEKNKRKIRKIMDELRKEDSHS